MTAIQTIENIGSLAVQKLDLQKLRNGQSFMTNSKDLKPSQCYLEYPDESIRLVYLKVRASDFTVIRTKFLNRL